MSGWLDKGHHRLLLLALAFALTRLGAGYLADHPETYPPGTADATADVQNYGLWAQEMQDEGRNPYRDFHVGYPPGALALANVPYAVDAADYRQAFVAESVLFDALGLWAMWRLARRRRSWSGVLLWLLLPPLLGPVAYTRLDIAVAACIAWAFERLEARRWTAAGSWLGLGAAVKVVPVLLLPIVALAAPRRWRPVVAAAGVVLVFIGPFATDLSEMYAEVMSGNVDRGVHAESLWGSLVLLGALLTNTDVDVSWAFGAADISTSFDGLLGLLSNLAALTVLITAAYASRSRGNRGDGPYIVLICAAALILMTAVGRVFSPQYLLWSVAAAASGISIVPRQFRWPSAFLGVAIILAHVVYPPLYFDYLRSDPTAVIVGAIRNGALLAAGVSAAAVAWRYEHPREPAPISLDAAENNGSPEPPQDPR